MPPSQRVAAVTQIRGFVVSASKMGAFKFLLKSFVHNVRKIQQFWRAVQVLIIRRAHKYFPVHRAVVNTTQLSRA